MCNPRKTLAALYLTRPQIDLLLTAVNRLKIEMSEPVSEFNGTQLRVLTRVERELLLTQAACK